ncbi:purine-cytosine permease family protein [Actinopolymorpha pittospori]|uniref:Purine-cytosine permease-like protein n=1 Tax=Actinopolymorpha pittospori TaxID=648752 RepID=A0A927N6C6_9ACTN|nr:cytosine permease [Actinopolymorpha pittospori]MBE1612974.1 purine-cytosine permease-like protein [Actinopolymorpha pittospori]
MATTERSSPTSRSRVEHNGINVIAEDERRGRPRDLWWPWCAANISVLAISYGSFLLGFGISFWQALVAGVVGTVLSFLLVGLVSLAGKRGSAPTMVLSRAAFGVRGNALPSAVSYLLLVGWETVLVALATLATATVFGRLGWSDGTATKVVAFVVVAAVIIVAGCLGFDAIMRLQSWLTVALAVLTVGYVALSASHIDWSSVGSLPSGSTTALLGALVLAATALGLGWVNAGADYSRYLPRSVSSRAVVGWTTLGASLAPVVLVVDGLLLAGSDEKLAAAVGADPIGALTSVLPTWYLVPFAFVAVFGLVAGAVLDIYSSGLTLLTLGLRVARWKAALVDGLLMVAGTVWIVFFATDVIGPFQGFLITLGVPITAWCGVFVADLALRRRPYAQADLYDSAGRYGAFGPSALASMVAATVVGWGLVVNTNSSALAWQGFLLDPLGLGPKLEGPWTYANLGVLAALVIGFVGHWAFGRGRVADQERVHS